MKLVRFLNKPSTTNNSTDSPQKKEERRKRQNKVGPCKKKKNLSPRSPLSPFERSLLLLYNLLHPFLIAFITALAL